jgi:hypothetical protein
MEKLDNKPHKKPAIKDRFKIYQENIILKTVAELRNLSQLEIDFKSDAFDLNAKIQKTIKNPVSFTQFLSILPNVGHDEDIVRTHDGTWRKNIFY